jgi:hypothetical protein
LSFCSVFHDIFHFYLPDLKFSFCQKILNFQEYFHSHVHFYSHFLIYQF